MRIGGDEETIVYFKAVRPNGRDFWTNSVQWAPPEGQAMMGSRLVEHPNLNRTVGYGLPYVRPESASTYLSVSRLATACTGALWPCRLLMVAKGDHPVFDAPSYPHKRASLSWRVLQETKAHRVFGPEGAQVADALGKIRLMTPEQMHEAHRLGAGDRSSVPARVLNAIGWALPATMIREAVADGSRESSNRNGEWFTWHGQEWLNTAVAATALVHLGMAEFTQRARALERLLASKT